MFRQVKKVFLFILSIFLLSVIVFYVSRLAPGDPLISYYGDRGKNEPRGEAVGGGKAGAGRACPHSICALAWQCSAR